MKMPIWYEERSIEEMLLAQSVCVTLCQYLGKAGGEKPSQVLQQGVWMQCSGTMQTMVLFSGTSENHGLSRMLSPNLSLFWSVANWESSVCIKFSNMSEKLEMVNKDFPILTHWEY